MVITAQQQAELGSQLADLKARLHDAENCISRNEMNSIDWSDLAGKLSTVLGNILNNQVGRLNFIQSPPMTCAPELLMNDGAHSRDQVVVDPVTEPAPDPAHAIEEDDDYDPYREDD